MNAELELLSTEYADDNMLTFMNVSFTRHQMYHLCKSAFADGYGAKVKELEAVEPIGWKYGDLLYHPANPSLLYTIKESKINIAWAHKTTRITWLDNGRPQMEYVSCAEVNKNVSNGTWIIQPQ